MSEPGPIDHDVVVVGGGPAGSVLALRLAQLGHSVTLIERARFPRKRLGESLTPGVLPLLASVGAARGVEAGALRSDMVRVRWEGEPIERRDPTMRALLVDRGVFDLTLLTHARQAGVRVLQPATVLRAHEHAEGWALEVETTRGPTLLRARFLADASGRGSRLGVQRRWSGPRTFAVHGYLRGHGLPREPRIEATPRGWTWGVPIPDGSYDTLAFLDVLRVRAERVALTDRAAIERLLRLLLDESSLGPAVRGATLEAPARIVDATPYVDERTVGARHVRVGEAALALDPLSSSGVQKAIQTALSGAIVAHTLLARPEARELAIRFHDDQLRAASARHRAWAEGHYRLAAPRFDDAFWVARSGDASRTFEPSLEEKDGSEASLAPREDAPLRLSSDARFADVPCLGAEFVEQRRALVHPALDGPIAFVGGHAIAPLLEDLPPLITEGTLVASWSRELPTHAAHSIARWLTRQRILVCEPGA